MIYFLLVLDGIAVKQVVSEILEFLLSVVSGELLIQGTLILQLVEHY